MILLFYWDWVYENLLKNFICILICNELDFNWYIFLFLINVFKSVYEVKIKVFFKL